MRRGSRVCITLLASLALLFSAGCGDDPPGKMDLGSKKDGRVDGGGGSAEDTATACNDGKDNDGDGDTDCADSQCQSFAFCGGTVDAGPDGVAKDGPRPDGPAADAGVDAPAPDATTADAGVDAPAPDATLNPDTAPTPDTTATPDTAPTPDTVAPDTVAPDTLAHDTVAHDTLAHDTLAHDTLAHDTLAPDTTRCGNNLCETGERCIGTFTYDAGAGTTPCADCPVKISPANKAYCCIEGVCVSAVASACTGIDCKPAN